MEKEKEEHWWGMWICSDSGIDIGPIHQQNLFSQPDFQAFW
jgi:hypothetical protein